MLAASYSRLLLPADVRSPSTVVIPEGSVLERAAGALVDQGVWLTWRGGALEQSIEEGVGVSPARERVEAYLDQVAAVEGWPRHEAVMRLGPRRVASACGLPVALVERLMRDLPQAR